MDKKELLAKRAQLVAQARELLNKKEFTAEDQAQFDAMMADADALKAQVERAERLEQMEASLNLAPTPSALGSVAALSSNPVLAQADKAMRARSGDAYAQAFWAGIRNTPDMLSAEASQALKIANSLHVTAPGDKGGYLVPLEFETTLIRAAENFNIMRQLATVMSSGVDRQIPMETDAGVATWLGEEEAYTESDATFNKVNMGSHKLGRIIKVSEELLQDAFFDISAYVADAFGRTFGRAEEAAFVNGDGTGKPKGLVPSVTTGVTAADDVTIAADDLIELFHSLRRPYRPTATWLMSDASVKAIRKLKDNDGQYLWQPGLTAGAPDTLLGRPVQVSDYMDNVAASKVPVVFGDLKYYRILDRKGITMQRLNELYAANGQVGFRMYERTEGKLLLGEAVKKLTMAAA